MTLAAPIKHLTSHPVGLVHTTHGHTRQSALAFIRDQFRHHFSTQVADDTADLYALHGTEGEVIAAFGLRWTPADFFANHYVPNLAQQLSARFVIDSYDKQTVELTHLAVANKLALATVAKQIPPIALNQGRRVMVCTATHAIRRFLLCSKLATTELGQAKVTAMPVAEQSAWGNYFDCDPVVVAGDLVQAQRVLEEIRHD